MVIIVVTCMYIFYSACTMHNVYHSLGGLSLGAIAGISIAIACVIIALVIVAVAAVSRYEWKGLFLCYLCMAAIH